MQKQEQFDPLLLDYALAALAYAKRLSLCGVLLSAVAEKQPDLTYPRFDLALILKRGLSLQGSRARI